MPNCLYSLSDSVDLSRHIKCVHNKVKNNKCPQYLYSLSDSGDMSRHIKCAKLHVIVDESGKIKRRNFYFVIPKNPETILRKSHPD
jgi:hypothetical protein